MSGAPWTPEREDALRKLVAKGHTFAECAAILHTTRSAVGGQAARIGLRSHNPQGGQGRNRPVRTPRPPPTVHPRRDIWIAWFIDAGWSPREVRVLFGECGT